MTVTWAACLILAYLVGTIPSAMWVAGWRGHDPTREGSGNPGASNVFRV
ncbi:MAG: glycerol-3-phosphate acyltransferase, partial [Acidimicrobiales bacterium]|nr:glycerol-3-phosphate acyltransferase [Acidimicrobiales bacterium]